MAGSSISEGPHSGFVTSRITSQDHSSKLAGSDRIYTLKCNEPANLDDSLGLLANIVSVYERADDANRRLCNQAFFHRIFIEEEGDVRVEYERPFGSLCDTEEQMNALNWAAEAKKKGEAQTGQRVVTLVEGLNLSHMGSLRRQFSNPTPKLKSLISRWTREVYRVSQRIDSAPMHDVRELCVRRIGKPQTFLTIDEATEAVRLHGGGVSMRAIARTLGIDREQVRVSLV